MLLLGMILLGLLVFGAMHGFIILLIEVWGPGSAGNTHYLRVQMHGLRHKLEAVPARPSYLITEPGVGYRLRDEA